MDSRSNQTSRKNRAASLAYHEKVTRALGVNTTRVFFKKRNDYPDWEKNNPTYNMLNEYHPDGAHPIYEYMIVDRFPMFVELSYFDDPKNGMRYHQLTFHVNFPAMCSHLRVSETEMAVLELATKCVNIRSTEGFPPFFEKVAAALMCNAGDGVQCCTIPMREHPELFDERVKLVDDEQHNYIVGKVLKALEKPYYDKFLAQLDELDAEQALLVEYEEKKLDEELRDEFLRVQQQEDDEFRAKQYQKTQWSIANAVVGNDGTTYYPLQ
jgi:hypothetical protein